MSPLPRILAMALLVVLAALLAALAAPHLTKPRAEPAAAETGLRPPAPAKPAQLAVLAHRIGLGLAAVALALAVLLVFSVALRPGRPAETKAPFADARTEMNALTRLAESTAAQGVELNRERDVRRRAEEDAQFQQRLLAQSLEEKIRLGRDLHDGIIQSLYAVGLTLETARVLVHTQPAEADRKLEQARAAINGSIRDVRAYITGLGPENLRRAGFAHAVEALLAELQAGRETRFDVKIDEHAAALLSAEQSQQTLQIAREAVSNALRHGGASLVTLRLHLGDSEVCLLVQDNGIGFVADARRPGGHGLTNMHARAERLGAALRITSRPGEGARVIATVPLLRPAASS
ncbi:MAG: hypothetical protein B9S34_14955 [Opitutia bacterium Tous-C1TDCM]|nr:MAG: hypothetical protein B9S34_14955 [Opitutae bacterium Tous-C1TDCM]